MSDKKYFDVYYQPGPKPVFCYRSGLMVYEEHIDSGVLSSGGYNTAGYPLNVLAFYPTRLQSYEFVEASAFNLEIDGQCIDYGMKFIDFTTEKDENGISSVLTLESTIKPVRVKVHTRIDGTQMFTRYLEIENLSDEYLNVSRMSVLSGGIERMNRDQLTHNNDVSKYYSVGYFDHVDWGKEGDFAWHDLQPDILTIDTRFKKNRFRHPAVFIRNNVLGRTYFAQIGWSGGCSFTIDYDAHDEKNQTRLSMKMAIEGHNPMIVLAPHEVFFTPEVYMGVVQGGLDEAVNEMNDHIRTSVLTMPEADGKACIIGAGMGAEHNMVTYDTKKFIDQFAEMGAEMFIIDAGYYSPMNAPGQAIDWVEYNGVNRPDPERYPGGLKEVSDYCHSKGLGFALWTEIERLGAKTEVLAQHPEWISKVIQGWNYPRKFIDFTIPEAAKWAEDELARMIEEYDLDLLRVDYNVDFKLYSGIRDMGSGRKECISLRHFNAVYKMYRNLKKRFPNVIFENCASGGGRTDLGIMKAFNHTWVTDWQRTPGSVLITNGMTLVLPPERVDRLFAGMNCHEVGALDLHMRNTMLTHMSLNVMTPVGADYNPEQMEFVRHSTEIYKNFIRKFLAESNIYHYEPEAKKALDNGFTAIEVSSKDGRRGAIGAFALTSSRKDSYTLIPRGIKAGLKYKVTLDNSRQSFEVSGYELSTVGIKAMIPASLSSELVLYEAVE